MKSKALCARAVSAAAAVVMCLSAAPAMYLGSGYVCAAEGQSAQSISNGLPVVYITIDETAEGFGTIEEMNKSEDHSVRCTGNIRIDVPDGYTSYYSGSKISDTAELSLEYIRGRGNSTWLLDKKPYRIKLNKGADLLGMGKNKHWALLANRLDASLMRNRVASYIAEKLGLEYTPKMLPVDVVMNGEYIGSYVLSELVRVDSNRVEIDELTESDDAEPEITGGYLFSLEQEQVPADTDKLFVTDRNVHFKFNTPSFVDGDGTAAQRKYITDYLQQTEDAIFGDDFKDKNGVSYTDYLDIESAANYWWLQEFMLNKDAFVTDSTYFYKKRDGKLYFGPLWDSDIALGLGNNPETEMLNSAPMIWLDHLRTFEPEYQALLLERWKVLDSIAEDLTKDGGYIDKISAEIKDSFTAELDKWGPPDQILKETGDLAKETADLKEFINDRRAYINAHLSELTKALTRVTFVADGNTVYVGETMIGLPLPYYPEAPKKEGYFFLGWKDEKGEFHDPSYDFEDHTTLTAYYIPDEEVIRAKGLYFQTYDFWLQLGVKDYSLRYAVVPYDTQDTAISWSVAETDLAEVDERGFVKVKTDKENIITVTGELSNGVKNTYRLHLYDPGNVDTFDVKSIDLESDRLDLYTDEFGQVKYTCSPQPCMSFVEFSSSDTSVAEVDDLGVVHAKAPGTAVITVKESYADISAQYTVYVTEKTPEDSSQPEEGSSQTEESSQPESSSSESQPESSKADSSSKANSENSSKQNDNPKTGTAAGAFLIAAASAALIAVRKKTK